MNLYELENLLIIKAKDVKEQVKRIKAHIRRLEADKSVLEINVYAALKAENFGLAKFENTNLLKLEKNLESADKLRYYIESEQRIIGKAIVRVRRASNLPSSHEVAKVTSAVVKLLAQTSEYRFRNYQFGKF